MRPIFGLPAQTLYSPIRNRYVVPDAQTLALEEAGITPVILPSIQEVQDQKVLLEKLDALLISRRLAVAPMLYDQDPATDRIEYNLQDDLQALDWIGQALAMKKPVFAFGNGMHLLNVYFGGSLTQDLVRKKASVIHSKADGDFVDHFIEMVAGTRLHAVLGAKVIVNSGHEEGIDKLGQGLVPSAHARDGLIEAFESEDGLAFGFQAHPENMRGSLKTLFDAMAREVVK